MDYFNYSSIDFVLDDDFFRWIVQADAASDKFWNAWLEQNPHKRREVEEARRWILEFSTQIRSSEVKEMPQKELMWKRIVETIKNEDNAHHPEDK